MIQYKLSTNQIKCKKKKNVWSGSNPNIKHSNNGNLKNIHILSKIINLQDFSIE